MANHIMSIIVIVRTVARFIVNNSHVITTYIIFITKKYAEIVYSNLNLTYFNERNLTS